MPSSFGRLRKAGERVSAPRRIVGITRDFIAGTPDLVVSLPGTLRLIGHFGSKVQRPHFRERRQ